MDENLSGFDMQEYWEYMHKFNSDFNKIFGVKNERTQQTESDQEPVKTE